MDRSSIDKLCVALDISSSSEAEPIISELSEYVGTFKIGMQLFTSEGINIIKVVQGLGGNVFLDLKFHDIPNTVAGASRAAVKLGVKIFNIHALGGSEMIRAAVTAARNEADHLAVVRPLVLAVTVLTSIDPSTLKRQLLVQKELKSFVMHLASIAQECGADGVVCSPEEVEDLRKLCGTDFTILTPGIRPSWASAKQDQKRVTTPEEAIKRGADILVIGRPILRAQDRRDAAQRVLNDIEKAG